MTSSRLTRAVGIFVLTITAATHAARADENAGAYLAARLAASEGDYPAAARYFEQALMLDPGNPFLVDNTIAAFVAIGETSRAAPYASQAARRDTQSQIAAMVDVAAQGRAADWNGVVSAMSRGRATAGPLLDELALGWGLMGAGDTAAALRSFEAMAAQPGLGGFGLYHQALALTLAGDDAGAEAILSLSPQDGLPRSRRTTILRAEVLGRLGRFDDAVALIDASFDVVDPGLRRLRAALREGTVPPSSIARSVRDGLAEAYFSVGSAISGQADNALTLMYFRLAEHLSADHAEATLRTAGILDEMGRHRLASAAFASIPEHSFAYHAAALGQAEAIRKAGDMTRAAELLEVLCRRYETALNRATQGDVLRQLGRLDEALAAYTRALELYDDRAAARWFVLYTRGITLEHLGEWDAAEADFRASLALNPDQPQVLNHLGYSLVEKNIKLDEALAMLRRAVQASPQNGHIVDSLGWVLYRLGRYDEAVTQLERAAELNSAHPVIVDHLGDAYWVVGRQTEARFQWRRALSFGPAAELRAALQSKLDHGLDAAQVSVNEVETVVQVAHGDRQ